MIQHALARHGPPGRDEGFKEDRSAPDVARLDLEVLKARQGAVNGTRGTPAIVLMDTDLTPIGRADLRIRLVAPHRTLVSDLDGGSDH